MPTPVVFGRAVATTYARVLHDCVRHGEHTAAGIKSDTSRKSSLTLVRRAARVTALVEVD